MSYEITKITVEFDCTEYAVKNLTELLRAMAMCHANGMSRTLSYYCDGDGNSPRIVGVAVNGVLTPLNELPKSDEFRRIIEP